MTKELTQEQKAVAEALAPILIYAEDLDEVCEENEESSNPFGVSDHLRTLSNYPGVAEAARNLRKTGS